MGHWVFLVLPGLYAITAHNVLSDTNATFLTPSLANIAGPGSSPTGTLVVADGDLDIGIPQILWESTRAGSDRLFF
jgi:hypothetical protein